ncbi:SDR family oxidoreductase [Azoarcus sp. L1K30]|uniref:SDR family NAD(P)-dependent oxidoreductase n=1 Tax=Azoarcus sp. L1K30 TaxID=2820277 RepID=UPI001B81E29F|nr:SDR family oxidoreductase [Azoarcus sp. L1K30]MBR0564717.1 SDR family oxidoreductase [Azoarcus sp. L1K30]
MGDTRLAPVAIITGAADGIGWATAMCMATKGWQVVVVDIHAEQARTRATELGEAHLGLGCDVTRAGDVDGAIDRVLQRYGRIDALVNNAGIGDQTVPTLHQTAEAFDRVLAVHLRGTFLMSQAALGHMRNQTRDERGNRGAVVNLGSIAGLGGIPGRNAYCAAKAGVLGMTRAMAVEWAREGIRFNAVAPGYVRTPMVAALALDGAIDEQAILGRTPMGRMAHPDEIAASIEFLASSAASFITGATLSADGGWSVLGAPESALGQV